MKNEINSWNELREGHSSALRDIYNQFYKPMMNYGLRLTPNNDLVQDCIHDLFADLWRLRSGLGETDSVRNYLIGSLRRRILKSIQDKSNKHSELSEQYDREDEDSNFEISLIQDETNLELSLKLQAAIGTLSKRQQEAIYLKYSEGLDYEQICETMGLQYQSVRNLISTGILRIKENLLILLFIVDNFLSTFLKY
ncbi:MAG: sigma-70 family RNA polymerase sigma factor [Saprospiraceae bacterium]|nr:sigma-70 family RNA polymerase sigma factor [Saprospiraceae bacterium]MBK7811284.1 sigma-70 family RNA polymerase sigma factor [Saprospiraceae bacterium]MBK9631013.1 sigma-70 family RNA polymerase sigma factor [Saprospiraceae bacterium]